VLSYLLEYALGTTLKLAGTGCGYFHTQLIFQVFPSNYTLQDMVIKWSDLKQKFALTKHAVLVTPCITWKHQMSPSPPTTSTGSRPTTFGQVLENSEAKCVQIAPFPFKPTRDSGSQETLNAITKALFASIDKLMDWEPHGNEDSAAEMKDR
jgi:hypothetical protein